MVSTAVLIGLIAAAFGAGWVNAVVGGGGLIMLPSLLVSLPREVPVASVVGTNKTAQVVGNITAGASYLRRQRPTWRIFLWAAFTALLGALAGVRVLRLMSRDVYTPILLVVLVVIGVFTWRRPTMGVKVNEADQGGHSLLMAIIGFFLGFYDAAIGPGVGTFWVLAFVAVGGYSFLRASGMAKMCNSVTNLVTIVTLALHGAVLWHVVWPLVIANVTGGLVGARTAQKHGDSFVRKAFLVVIAVLGVKLLVEMIWGG